MTDVSELLTVYVISAKNVIEHGGVDGMFERVSARVRDTSSLWLCVLFSVLQKNISM